MARTVVLFSQPVDMGSEEPKPHHQRDLAAIDDIYDTMRRDGDQVVRVINVNHPDLAHDNVHRRLRSGDLVVQACRVRKNEGRRKVLPYSGTDFEAMLNGAHDQWIAHSSRDRIALTESGALALDHRHKRLADLHFSTWSDASYVRLRRKHTAGYIVFTKELWPDGPGHINVFGPSGPVTQGLACAIRNRCRDQMVFTESELIVVEIWARSPELQLVPRPTPAWLVYSDEWSMAWHRNGAVRHILPQTPAKSAGHEVLPLGERSA